MKTLRVGIASYREMKARTIAIARGARRPGPEEPKVWFSSAESFARIVSERNRALLRVKLSAESAPESLTQLSELTGRKKPNLSRTLKTMECYGLVRLKRGARGAVVPNVPYDAISLVLPVVKATRTRRAA